ncbi:response regulator transcription factor [Chryseobacterium sp. MYb264]|uniref:response regulator n=1 Tax=Chryseobacterium sp. MYb264 TaxID=2745153 RepID=UPI002E13C82D|nr:response regulator transcription factor [Chryseobacterium sp. MYb264]
MSISIAIVEDEKNYNNALKKVINYQKDMKVVAQFFDGNDALHNLPDFSPDVVMMDIQLQDMLGIEIIEKLKKDMPETQFIMCTSFEDDEKIFNSLKAGAIGYLIKGESMDKILASIRDVYNGGEKKNINIMDLKNMHEAYQCNIKSKIVSASTDIKNTDYVKVNVEQLFDYIKKIKTYLPKAKKMKFELTETTPDNKAFLSDQIGYLAFFNNVTDNSGKNIAELSDYNMNSLCPNQCP